MYGHRVLQYLCRDGPSGARREWRVLQVLLHQRSDRVVFPGGQFLVHLVNDLGVRCVVQSLDHLRYHFGQYAPYTLRG